MGRFEGGKGGEGRRVEGWGGEGREGGRGVREIGGRERGGRGGREEGWEGGGRDDCYTYSYSDGTTIFI